MLWNRTFEKASALVEEFKDEFPDLHLEAFENLEEICNQPIDLLVNTTSVGMDGQSSIVDLQAWKSVAHVADIIYKASVMRDAHNRELLLPCTIERAT